MLKTNNILIVKKLKYRRVLVPNNSASLQTTSQIEEYVRKGTIFTRSGNTAGKNA
jgi:hypothetical protein